MIQIVFKMFQAVSFAEPHTNNHRKPRCPCRANSVQVILNKTYHDRNVTNNVGKGFRVVFRIFLCVCLKRGGGGGGGEDETDMIITIFVFLPQSIHHSSDQRPDDVAGEGFSRARWPSAEASQEVSFLAPLYVWVWVWVDVGEWVWVGVGKCGSMCMCAGVGGCV